jgi:UDP-2,3-diacylglucosamine pyrophosphatase LpxH
MKRIFVSDVHMGAGRSFQAEYTGHVYDWLSQDEADTFAAFLQYLNDDASVDEVILLGDIMDNWVCPAGDIPPSFAEIVAEPINKFICTQFATLAQNSAKNLIYISGNHDMGITQAELDQFFPGISMRADYQSDSLFAGHGNQYALFCAPDPVNDPQGMLPLGYFISRVAATNAALTGSDNSFRYFVDDFMKELVKSKKLVNAVFEAIVEQAGLDDASDIIMPAGSIKISTVKRRYSNIYEQWDGRGTLVSASEALTAEISPVGLAAAARKLNMAGKNIIIFGHTHACGLAKLRRYDDPDAEYISANCGTWCDHDEKGKPFSFIEAEMNEPEGKHYVRLKTWNRETKQPADNFQEEVIEVS